jgi:hypothetical protein
LSIARTEIIPREISKRKLEKWNRAIIPPGRRFMKSIKRMTVGVFSRVPFRGLFRMIVMTIILVFVAGCAAGPNSLSGEPDQDGDVAGFWTGLWHGIIVPVTFVISLFSDSVSIYDVHNNGGWYDFGFIFGAAIMLGGGGRGSAGRRKD